MTEIILVPLEKKEAIFLLSFLKMEKALWEHIEQNNTESESSIEAENVHNKTAMAIGLPNEQVRF